MSVFLLAYSNRIDSATLSGGSWVSTLPLNNLKDRNQGVVARSTNDALASTKFYVDLGSVKTVRTFGAVNHSISLDGKIRVRMSETDATLATSDYDSGWLDVWPAISDSLDLDWEDDSFWSGQYSTEQLEGYNPTFIVSAPAQLAARYLLVEIDDQTNESGFIQIGRVFIGPAWQPEWNFTYGVGISIEDTSEIEEALSGAESFDERRKRRLARFNTDYLSENEAMAFAFEIKRRMGVTGEVIFQYDPSDTVHAVRRQFMGRLQSLDPITHPNLVQYVTGWEVRELL